MQDILEYLYKNYSNLDEGDLEKIDENINLPYDPSEPFSVFITRIEDGVDLAEAAGALYNTSQIIEKALDLIVKAQFFLTGTRE